MLIKSCGTYATPAEILFSFFLSILTSTEEQKLMTLKNGSVVDKNLSIYPRIKAQVTLKATNQRHLNIDRERQFYLSKWLEYG